jgi:hypothetical protein
MNCADLEIFIGVSWLFFKAIFFFKFWFSGKLLGKAL